MFFYKKDNHNFEVWILALYEGYPESNLSFGIKNPQVKGNIFYYMHLKATILNYFST